jgi:hypothetical protein
VDEQSQGRRDMTEKETQMRKKLPPYIEK